MANLKALYIALAVTVIYFSSRVIYNLFFHPLAKHPGPKLAAISNVWYCRAVLGGRYPFIVEELHLKYGDIVRIAPNELSIATVKAAKDIYGHRSKGQDVFRKSDFYTPAQGEAPDIVSERDPQRHQEVRRNLSNGFSTKALRMQTDVVIQYVDLFIKQLQKLAIGPEGLDMSSAFNWITFDIIGDLAFGEPFGSVAEGKTHFWVALIFNSPARLIFNDLATRFPSIRSAIPWLIPAQANALAQRDKHIALTQEKVNARLERGNTRDDFFSQLLSEKRGKMGQAFMLSNASTLIVAGSETTANSLTAATFNLAKSPMALKYLQEEIRGAFKDSSEINEDNTLQLPYLKAVIEESLRIFSPLAIGLPRESPGANVDGNYFAKGTILHSPLWFMAHSPQYWHKPYEFHPERWLDIQDERYDTAFVNDNKEASKPFSQGPRGCIGINLAYMELRIILAKMVWNFDWELVNKEADLIKDSLNSVIWKRPELRFRMIPRKM